MREREREVTTKENLQNLQFVGSVLHRRQKKICKVGWRGDGKRKPTTLPCDRNKSFASIRKLSIL